RSCTSLLRASSSRFLYDYPTGFGEERALLSAFWRRRQVPAEPGLDHGCVKPSAPSRTESALAVGLLRESPPHCQPGLAKPALGECVPTVAMVACRIRMGTA